MASQTKLLLFLITSFFLTGLSTTAFGQKTDTIRKADRQKMDSLSAPILEAHRTFKALSDDVAKQAKTNATKALASKVDSVFKARRGVVNALLNNLYLLPDSQKLKAISNLEFYLIGASNADRILTESKYTQVNAVAKFAGTMEASNNKVLNDLKFVAPVEGSQVALEVRPDNALQMEITFADQVNRSDYVFYLFPVIWCAFDDRLGPCYDQNQWRDLKNCGRIGMAKEWTDGRDKKLSGLYSGIYTVLVYRKSLNQVISKDQRILPLQDTFTYHINNN